MEPNSSTVDARRMFSHWFHHEDLTEKLKKCCEIRQNLRDLEVSCQEFPALIDRSDINSMTTIHRKWSRQSLTPGSLSTPLKLSMNTNTFELQSTEKSFSLSRNKSQSTVSLPIVPPGSNPHKSRHRNQYQSGRIQAATRTTLMRSGS